MLKADSIAYIDDTQESLQRINLMLSDEGLQQWLNRSQGLPHCFLTLMLVLQQVVEEVVDAFGVE